VPTSIPLIFLTGWMPFLPPNQQCQSIEGIIIQSNKCQHTFAMKMTEATTPFYQMSQDIHTKTRDSLMIVCAKNYCYCATFVKVITSTKEHMFSSFVCLFASNFADKFRMDLHEIFR